MQDAGDTKRVFLPLNHDRAAAAALRVQGWTTIAALSETDSAAALQCPHWLTNEGIVAVKATV